MGRQQIYRWGEIANAMRTKVTVTSLQWKHTWALRGVASLMGRLTHSFCMFSVHSSRSNRRIAVCILATRNS